LTHRKYFFDFGTHLFVEVKQNVILSKSKFVILKLIIMVLFAVYGLMDGKHLILIVFLKKR
jgi:hypothetical protein